MIEATRHLAEQYDIVLAGAPGIEPSYYEQFLQGSKVRLVVNETYPLLAQATAALVTSGTATLETCMFRVPQVVCYRTAMPRLFGFLRKLFLKVPYVSLVNLIANREVVKELVVSTSDRLCLHSCHRMSQTYLWIISEMQESRQLRKI